MGKLWISCRMGLLALTASLLMAPPSFAAKTINLTAIDGYPPKALWVKEFINFYIPQVNQRLAAQGKYKIRWNQAFGGQIVKVRHVLEGLQKGLGDIGVVTTVFHHDKVPFHAFSYVTPFVTTDPGLVARTMDEIAEKFPEMKKAWQSYNQVYLTSMAVFDTYQVFSKQLINDTGDFKGLKINGAGTNLRYLHGMGAAGVGGSLVSYYQNLKTGVVDGAMIWPEAAMTFKMYEVAPYMLDARLGTATSKAVTVNAGVWKRLPGEVKKVLAETAIAYRDHMAKVADDVGRKSTADFQARGGKVYKMTDAQRTEWARKMPNVAREWAQSMDKKGLPGTKVLRYYMDVMRKNNQPISRHWDRE